MATTVSDSARRSRLATMLRDNGLSLTLMMLFFLFWAGQAWVGQHQLNEEQKQHGQPQLNMGEYLQSSHFLEATAENWESEFLQMSAYVIFTCFMFQRGSAESKNPDEDESVDRKPQNSLASAQAPWPVRRGGWVLALYSNSLSIVLLSMFFASFALHAIAGTSAYNEAELAHGGQPVTTFEYLQSSQFWFESLQNWQSEFLAIAAMVVLSIFLRQRGSPESKPVDAPHCQTGTE